MFSLEKQEELTKTSDYLSGVESQLFGADSTCPWYVWDFDFAGMLAPLRACAPNSGQARECLPWGCCFANLPEVKEFTFFLDDLA